MRAFSTRLSAATGIQRLCDFSKNSYQKMGETSGAHRRAAAVLRVGATDRGYVCDTVEISSPSLQAPRLVLSRTDCHAACVSFSVPRHSSSVIPLESARYIGARLLALAENVVPCQTTLQP